MKDKKAIKALISILAFLFILWPVYQRTEEILRMKVSVNDTIGTFYDEPKDSLEVLFVGSSHVYRSISPMELWEQNGFTSYALSCASQPIPLSYFLTMEGIRKQHPKVVVLEAYGAQYDTDYENDGKLHYSVDALPWSAAKLELITDFLPRTKTPGQEVPFVFPIAAYHDRWDKLTEADFVPQEVYIRGFIPTTRTEVQEEPAVVTESLQLTDTVTVYFEKIVALCEKNQIPLVLYQAPSAKNDRYDHDQGCANALKELAEAHGIPFVDFENLREEIGLDYEKDFMNSTHVNLFGAKKITSYLGNYLSSQYQLPDHRDDPKFSQWNEDARQYREYMQKLIDRAKTSDAKNEEDDSFA